jgi:hypothetical protein
MTETDLNTVYFLPEWSPVPQILDDYNCTNVPYKEPLLRCIESMHEYPVSLDELCTWLHTEHQLQDIASYVKTCLLHGVHYIAISTGFAETIHMNGNGIKRLCDLKGEPLYAVLKATYIELEKSVQTRAHQVYCTQRAQIDRLATQYRDLQRRYDATMENLSTFETTTTDPQGPGIFFIATSRSLRATRIGYSFETSKKLTDDLLEAYGESLRLYIKVCTNPASIERRFHDSFRAKKIDRFLFHEDVFNACTTFLDNQIDELFYPVHII